MLDVVREPGFVTVSASGRLTPSDYEAVVPRLEDELEAYGALRLLIRLDDFKGWTPKALVEDLKFDFAHRKDVERVAVVGEHGIDRLATVLSKPMFRGEVRFFEDETEARSWLREPARKGASTTPTSAKVLAGTLLLSGAAKLFGAKPIAQSFEDWGYPRTFMYAVGIAEVAGAIGLLVPETRRVAALGVTALMGGAIATHVSHDESAKSLPAVGTLITAAKLAKPSA